MFPSIHLNLMNSMKPILKDQRKAQIKTTPMGMRKLSEKFIVTRQTMRRRELMNCQFLSNLLMYKATGIIIKMKPTFLYEHTFENNPGFRKLKNETQVSSYKKSNKLCTIHTTINHKHRSLNLFSQISLQNRKPCIRSLVKLKTWIEMFRKIPTLQKQLSPYIVNDIKFMVISMQQNTNNDKKALSDIMAYWIRSQFLPISQDLRDNLNTINIMGRRMKGWIQNANEMVMQKTIVSVRGRLCESGKTGRKDRLITHMSAYIKDIVLLKFSISSPFSLQSLTALMVSVCTLFPLYILNIIQQSI